MVSGGVFNAFVVDVPTLTSVVSVTDSVIVSLNDCELCAVVESWIVDSVGSFVVLSS